MTNEKQEARAMAMYGFKRRIFTANVTERKCKKQGNTRGVAMKRNLFDFTKLINREEKELLPIAGIYVRCEAFEYTLINVTFIKPVEMCSERIQFSLVSYLHTHPQPHLGIWANAAKYIQWSFMRFNRRCHRYYSVIIKFYFNDYEHLAITKFML